MSNEKPWYIDRPWCCRWCGNVMSEHSLYYQKNKRREFCNFRCLHDFRNFANRLFGKKKLKAIITNKNKTLMEWVYLIPFLMIERHPMKAISNHITVLLSATDNAEAIKFVQIKQTRTKNPDDIPVMHATIRTRNEKKPAKAL